ncbi:MAG: hypothetical protein ACOCVG_01985 [Verrucomicrobiota bacterium]
MNNRLKQEGHYEIFKTSNDHRVLTLDDRQWFAVVEGQNSDILVGSDADHEKDHTVREGRYFYAEMEDDPDFQDQPHLFMEEDGHFYEYLLPNGIPHGKGDKQRLIRTGERLPEEKVMQHVKG